MSHLVRKDLVDSLGRSTHRMVRPQVQPSAAMIAAAQAIPPSTRPMLAEKSVQGVYGFFKRVPPVSPDLEKDRGGWYKVSLEHENVGNRIHMNFHTDTPDVEPTTVQVMRSIAEDLRTYNEIGAKADSGVDARQQAMIRFGLTDDATEEADQIVSSVRHTKDNFKQLTAYTDDPYESIRAAIRESDGADFRAEEWPAEFGFEFDEALTLEQLTEENYGADRYGDTWVKIDWDEKLEGKWIQRDTHLDGVPVSGEEMVRTYGPFTYDETLHDDDEDTKD